MAIEITPTIRSEIQAHLQSAYPEEGAGFLLGLVAGDERLVRAIIPVDNAREDAARGNRYLITPQDTYRAELEAEAQDFEVLGVFHSHPDVPNVPSEFDREWALPWYSYIIVRVDRGDAVSFRSWRLSDDRSVFTEEQIN